MLRGVWKIFTCFREGGNIIPELLFNIVPAIIAIALFGTLVYLFISNSGIDEYSAPKELTNLSTMVLGYYIGRVTSRVQSR